MNKYHVHVYKVVGKLEYNINAPTGEDAKKIALERAKKESFKQSDCVFIALDFQIDDEDYNSAF